MVTRNITGQRRNPIRQRRKRIRVDRDPIETTTGLITSKQRVAPGEWQAQVEIHTPVHGNPLTETCRITTDRFYPNAPANYNVGDRVEIKWDGGMWVITGLIPPSGDNPNSVALVGNATIEQTPDSQSYITDNTQVLMGERNGRGTVEMSVREDDDTFTGVEIEGSKIGVRSSEISLQITTSTNRQDQELRIVDNSTASNRDNDAHIVGIEIVDGLQQPIADPLLWQVIDNNGNPVSNRFVRAPLSIARHAVLDRNSVGNPGQLPPPPSYFARWGPPSVIPGNASSLFYWDRPNILGNNFLDSNWELLPSRLPPAALGIPQSDIRYTANYLIYETSDPNDIMTLLTGGAHFIRGWSLISSKITNVSATSVSYETPINELRLLARINQLVVNGIPPNVLIYGSMQNALFDDIIAFNSLPSLIFSDINGIPVIRYHTGVGAGGLFFLEGGVTGDVQLTDATGGVSGTVNYLQGIDAVWDELDLHYVNTGLPVQRDEIETVHIVNVRLIANDINNRIRPSIPLLMTFIGFQAINPTNTANDWVVVPSP